MILKDKCFCFSCSSYCYCFITAIEELIIKQSIYEWSVLLIMLLFLHFLNLINVTIHVHDSQTQEKRRSAFSARNKSLFLHDTSGVQFLSVGSWCVEVEKSALTKWFCKNWNWDFRRLAPISISSCVEFPVKCAGDGEVNAEEFMRMMRRTSYGY